LLIIPIAILNIEVEDDRYFMEWVFRKYHRLMLKRAYDVVENLSDAEDVVGDAIVALIPHMGRLRKFDNKALIAYIVRTTVRAAYRYKTKSQKQALVNIDIEDVQDLQSDDEDVDAGVMRECSVESMRTALKQLRDTDREILLMRYFDMLDMSSIAEALNVTESTARSKLARARKRLYIIIKEQQENECE